MRKLLLALCCALALVSCNDDREHILKVYNWADYIDEDLLGEFEEWYREQTGEEVHVIYQLFDINEVMLSKIERGKEDYDVVCPSDYIIERMLRADLLLPIDRDFGDTPDYTVGVSPFIRDIFSRIDAGGKDANEYAVGYMWGTTGFLYNTRYVSEEDVSTWNALSDEKFSGKIFIKDAFRDIYSPILIYLKQDELAAGKTTMEELMYDSSDESIALVESYLKSIRGHVAGWEADFGKEEMTKEKAWLNMTWSGDASWAIEEAAAVGVSLDYHVPREGSNVWFDGWVIPKYARNVKAARYFIDFLCKPENAVRNMDAIGYVSVINGDYVLDYQNDEESWESTDASYFFGEGAGDVHVNPTQYPSPEIIRNCALMHDSGERTEKMLAMWSRVKGDNATGYTYVNVIIAITALAVGGILKRRRMMKHKALRPRKRGKPVR